MLGQDPTLLNNQYVRIIDTFLPQRTKRIVRIGEKLELTNFELSGRFCKDLIADAHGTKKFVRISEKKFVRISESSSYRVIELASVDCLDVASKC